MKTPKVKLSLKILGVLTILVLFSCKRNAKETQIDSEGKNIEYNFELPCDYMDEMEKCLDKMIELKREGEKRLSDKYGSDLSGLYAKCQRDSILGKEVKNITIDLIEELDNNWRLYKSLKKEVYKKYTKEAVLACPNAKSVMKKHDQL